MPQCLQHWHSVVCVCVLWDDEVLVLMLQAATMHSVLSWPAPLQLAVLLLLQLLQLSLTVQLGPQEPPVLLRQGAVRGVSDMTYRSV